MQHTLIRLAVIAFVVAVIAVPVGAAPAEAPFPATIDLPDGFFPEGIAIDGTTAYVGSLIDGAIVQQDLKTGETSPFAASPGPDSIAVGMDVDKSGRLWVAGGGPALSPTVQPVLRVYDSAGELVASQALGAAGFVNDVVVTADSAWFTDSFAAQLIRVPIGSDGTIGAAEIVALGGDWEQNAGFNANGIVATADGQNLIVAQSTAPDVAGAALYRVSADPEASELDAERIELDDTLAGADGLVLIGRTLYSVAGPAGVVKLRLAQALTHGQVVETIVVPDSITPTTAAKFGARLYVVDAKFPFFGDPTVPFHTTAIER